MKRFIVTAFFVLFFTIYPICQRNAYASPTSEILCNGWLAATTGIDCVTGNCTPNPSPDGGDKSSDTYTISDHIGVRGVCKDKFPTYGEREMFYRTSDDPLNMDLIVKRDYCWARYVFIPTPDNCGGPDWKWAFPFGYLSWSKGVNYAIWGDTITKTFSLQKRGSDNAQTIFWGSNHAYIDYEKVTGEKSGTVVDNPKRICAYFSPVAFGKIVSGSDKLIGCIDIPLNPAPDIYNKIIVPKSSVAVATDKKPDESSFLKPQIFLKVIDSAGQNVGPYIPLTYDLEKDSKSCSDSVLTLGDVYCPFIQPADPTKICAGLKDRPSSNIGCIDRPKPTGTIIIDTVHDYYIDNNCPDSDNKPSIFHSVKIQLKDPATNKLIKEFPGEGNGLRDYYACYQTAQDPKNPIILSGKDTVNIYGVQFSAVIPEFVDNDGKSVDYTAIGIENIRPLNFSKTYFYPPIILGRADQTGALRSCGDCFYYVSDKSQCIDNNPTSKQMGQSMCVTYNTPAGDRNRDSCKRDNKCYDFKHNPLPIVDVEKNSISCNNDPNNSDLSKFNEAEKAYCPGVYKLDQQKNRAICVNLDTNWPDFFDKGDKICAEIPGSFMQLGKDDISSLTGYVDFTKDKFNISRKYEKTDQLYGECDASMNLENEKCLSSDGKVCLATPLPDKIKGLTNAQVLDFKIKYSVINQYLYGDKGNSKNLGANPNLKNVGVNANVQAIGKGLMSGLGYTSSQQEFLTIDIPDGAPYRKLDGNFPIGTVHNGCRFTVGEGGCGKNTYTAPFLGNAYFDTSNYNMNIGTQLASTDNVNTKYPASPLDATGLVIKDVYIDGKCKDGFTTASDKPKRICRVIVDKNNKIITKSWSNQTLANPCTDGKKSNG
jgi:hypothetical protein